MIAIVEKGEFPQLLKYVMSALFHLEIGNWHGCKDFQYSFTNYEVVKAA